MSTELALIESALSITQVMEQRKLVMQLMKEAMTEGLHYGKIPGCGDKPTLMQPGAQLMACAFRLAPEYKITESSPMVGHREYAVSCRLTHGGAHIAEGVGLCSSMESKFRYRNAVPIIEETGKPVTKDYWDLKDKPELQKKYACDNFGTPDVKPKKNGNGEWKFVIYRGGGDGRIENPNIADTFNTVLKMAKKRAYVDACITATACNDLFTQDLEDIRENLAAVEVESTPMPSRPEQPNVKQDTPVKAPFDPSSTYEQKAADFTQATQGELPAETQWQGRVITNVTERTGTKKSGKPWTLYDVMFDDGKQASTFDAKLGDQCREAGKKGDTVHALVRSVKDRSGKWELVKIEVDDMPL